MNTSLYKEHTDEELILLLQKNDDIKAFDELVFRYKDRIMNIMFNFINDRNEAEDLTQDAFLKLYKYKDQYKKFSKFSTWFFAIAMNTARNSYKKSKDYFPVSIYDVDEEDLQTPDMILDLDEYEFEDINNVRLDCLKRSFDLLDPMHKEVIILRFTEEKEYEEIAIILNIPAGTVKSRVNRGRERLKKNFVKLYRE
ncbi:MAG: sigma-70 family RNA polymerase sigma factor [Ignavibacteria bacterium]